MPDMLAHYEVAEAARARLPQSPLARVLAAEHDAFKVGAQGPDFFFYSHAWPGQRSRGDLAFLVHQHRTSEVFRALLSAAAEASPRERPVICAFTCGYAAHVCLDADAHPWIQYWTGDITAGVDTPSGASARRRHGVLEASIDLTLSGRHSADPGWIRSRRLLDMPRYQRAVVASVWSRLMAEVHGVAYSAAEGRAAFRDMAFVYGSMTDRHSALSLVLAALAPWYDDDGLVRTQIYPAAPHPTAAALLAGRRPWYYPTAPGERRTETFMEIFERAIVETVLCLEAIENAALRGGDADAAVAVIGDRNMLTGVPCEDPRPRVAFAWDPARIWGIA